MPRLLNPKLWVLKPSNLCFHQSIDIGLSSRTTELGKGGRKLSQANETGTRSHGERRWLCGNVIQRLEGKVTVWMDVPVSLAGADDGGPQISGKGMLSVGNVVTEGRHRGDRHGQIPL